MSLFCIAKSPNRFPSAIDTTLESRFISGGVASTCRDYPVNRALGSVFLMIGLDFVQVHVDQRKKHDAVTQSAINQRRGEGRRMD